MTVQHAGMAAVTRQVRVGCEFRYTAEVETAAVFQVQPSGAAPVTVLRQGWETLPATDRHGYTDMYGNDCQRLSLPVGDTTLRYDAVVTVPDATEDVDLDASEVPAAHLPDDVLVYTLPSRYCLPDVLGDEAWRLFGNEKPGYRRVQAICDHVNGHLRFGYGSSNPTTTAADAYAAGTGVCRDFAHVAITLLPGTVDPGPLRVRLPPRHGRAAGPGADGLRRLDGGLPRRQVVDLRPPQQRPRKGRVLIGRGRDASDVAMVTTFGGPVLQGMQVWAEETT